MEIIFLGTGTGIPSKERGSPALIIRHDEETFLFDCGPGTLIKMAQEGLTYHDPDYIIFTHFHVDHSSDMAPFLFASRYSLSRREKPLAIIGPPGLKDFLEKLESLYPGQLTPDSYKLTIHEIDGGEIQGKGWILKAFSVPHTDNSLGYRFENWQDLKVTISGDCDFTENLIEMGKCVDILILECSFPEEVEGHLSPEKIVHIACKATPKKLIITHLYPICQSSEILNTIKRKYFEDVRIAQDRLRVMLP